MRMFVEAWALSVEHASCFGNGYLVNLPLPTLLQYVHSCFLTTELPDVMQLRSMTLPSSRGHGPTLSLGGSLQTRTKYSILKSHVILYLGNFSCFHRQQCCSVDGFLDFVSHFTMDIMWSFREIFYLHPQGGSLIQIEIKVLFMVNKLSPKSEERGLASSYIKFILILIIHFNCYRAF
jgi:hypothetical protein